MFIVEYEKRTDSYWCLLILLASLTAGENQIYIFRTVNIYRSLKNPDQFHYKN